MEKKNKKIRERNSYYYYYNTIFFLKDCCILRKDQKPCCLQKSPPLCAREVSSERSCWQAHPSLLPLHHTPSNERRLFTSNPAVVPTGEGDIPTRSHSFLLLWKIKVKKPPTTSYCSISWGLASSTSGEEREGKAQSRDVPWTSHNLWKTLNFFCCCFVMTKGMRLT